MWRTDDLQVESNLRSGTDFRDLYYSNITKHVRKIKQKIVMNPVRATSVLLLLGVGSFICYKLYNQLKRRLRKTSGSEDFSDSEELLNGDENYDPCCIKSKYFGPKDFFCEESDISETSHSSKVDTNSAPGDRDTTSDDLTDEESVMGITSSNQYEPVSFNKTSGVHFRKIHPFPSTSDDQSNAFSESSNGISHSPNSSRMHSVKTRHKKRNSFKKKSFDLEEESGQFLSSQQQEGSLESSKSFFPFEESVEGIQLGEAGTLLPSIQSTRDADKIPSLTHSWSDSNPVEHDCDSLFLEGSFWSHDADSLKGNFSPHSLRERNFMFEKKGNYSISEYINQEENLSGNANMLVSNTQGGQLRRDFSGESLSSFSDMFKRSSSQLSDKFGRSNSRTDKLWRDISLDSEYSEFSLDVQSSADDIGLSTVEKLDKLQNQLNELKEAVLELDADVVNMKVYRQPPQHIWEITSVPLSEVEQHSCESARNSGVLDVINLHKAKIWYRGLLRDVESPQTSFNVETQKPPLEDKHDSQRTDLGSNASLPVDTPVDDILNFSLSRYKKVIYKFSKELPSAVSQPVHLPSNYDGVILDSGSDFGNSLDSDSPCNDDGFNRGPQSLEWDSCCLPKVENNSVVETFEIDRNSSGKMSSSERNKLMLKSQLTINKNDNWSYNKNVSKSESCDVVDNVIKTKPRSMSTPCGLLAKQIQLAIAYKRSPKVQKKLLIRSHTFSSYLEDKSIHCSVPQEVVGGYSLVSPLSNESSFVSPGASSFFSSVESGFQGSVDRFSRQNTLELEVTDECCDTSSQVTLNDQVEKHSFKHETSLVDNVIKKDRNGNSLQFLVMKNKLPVPAKQGEKCAIWDSAYCDESPSLEVVKCIGKVINVEELVCKMQESKATSQVDILTKGYIQIISSYGWNKLRLVRRDEYCALRASLFQALSQGLPVLQHYGGASTVYQKLEKWLSDSCPWLKLWNFSEELPYRKTNCLQGFQTCLQMLEETEKEVAITTTDVEDFLVTKLNSNPTLDLHLMEAVKLLMLVSAIELYPRYQSQENLPVFIWLLFARETSRTPKDLMLNHLNALKQTKHIREVELYLLGYSLFVTLKVFQLLHYGGDNFVTHYPEWNIGTWPEIVLIAENDLCYNTIVR
ncbi:uncharacterized protein LOC143248463 isoform X2 [Tachypleus tridentatus]|uniref:uncharacterized protein LOC143248463 isoform X2 n=1 Tax=Tachypleus tridentatus TaxID=6853 RepID=UPI003FD3C9ED